MPDYIDLNISYLHLLKSNFLSVLNAHFETFKHSDNRQLANSDFKVDEINFRNKS